MNDSQLAEFLVQAKRATYAAQGDSASVAPLLPGSRQLEYQLGDVLYRDIYFGMDYFVGQETVYENGRPIWAMSYAGGMTDPTADRGAAYGFLQFALRRVETASPFRGPGLIRGDGYQYTSQTTGTIQNFWGIERIGRNHGIIYEMRYHGGKII
ncbi:MAG: hypothetical protein IT331_00280 [Anaerolineae bacterium]|nr:hypothetical protein [Anaerolineae bacterium]